MTRFLLTIIAVVTFGTISFPSQSSADSYFRCQPQIAPEGRVFVLVNSDEYESGKCWKYVKNGMELNREELSDYKGSYQFSLFLEETPDQMPHDQIFSVQIRELRADDEKSDPYIELLRDRIKTMCRDPYDKKAKETFWGFFSAEYPGHKFNNFHGSSSVTRGRLADFHIAFINAQKKCVRTDQEEGGYKKSFLIEGVTFPDVPEFRLFANLLKEFARNTALAEFEMSDYKKVRVRIRQASFVGNGLLSVNFFVSEGEQSDINIQNLTETRYGQNTLLRPYRIKIR
jgi:hypothetical protein